MSRERGRGDLVLRNVRPMGGAPQDIHVRDGVIAASETAGRRGPAERPGAAEIDGGGALLLPGLVDGHIHLDKVLWGLPWHPMSAGPSLMEMIENEKRVRRDIAVPVRVRAGNLLRQMIACGTTSLRTHVDIDPDYGLANLEGVLEAKQAYRDEVDIEIVAFPQAGVMRFPGTADLLDAALAAGAALIGGIDPAGIDKDPAGQLNLIFSFAERRGKGIDIHLHDPGELGAFELDMILDRVAAHGMRDRVTVSHGFCLAMVDEERFAGLAARMARNGVRLVTNAPGGRAMPPVKKLRAAGVAVFAGTDAMRDTWTPYGNGDMLERAMMVGYRSNFRRDEDLLIALDLASGAGARALGIDRHGLAVGCRADFFTVKAETVAEGIVSHPPREIVFKAGSVVARGGTHEGAGDRHSR